MTPQEARSQFNFLMTLCLRKEESFGPLALAFMREDDLAKVGLSPEEQFNLYMATADAFAPEPKRYSHKLECLQKAQEVLRQAKFSDPGLAQYLAQELQKTSAELEIYNEAIKGHRGPSKSQLTEKQRIIVETDWPDYFLTIAQKRASEYYQNKYSLPKEAKTAQHFGGPARKFEPENPVIHKEFPGACAPFMSARTGAFHMMLPFDLKISRTPEDPLDAGVRIFYAKMGYSFPLRYELGKLCGYHDGQVLDLAPDDPHLIFVSFSPVKEPELNLQNRLPPSDIRPEEAMPLAFLEHTGSLGPYIQVSCNFKVWFDASAVSLLIQGAPDLTEYGLQGGAGLMTRSYASDKVHAYVESFSQSWQEGLSFNFVNLHLMLLPGMQSASVPFNTPIFSVYPVLSRQTYRYVTREEVEQESAKAP
ncbi:MAG: hypothetical protein ACE5NA_01450 [Nitrospiraceae bacterium]